MHIVTLFGAGKDLIVLQLGMRALVVFFVALLLIRVSGRRSVAATDEGFEVAEARLSNRRDPLPHRALLSAHYCGV